MKPHPGFGFILGVRNESVGTPFRQPARMSPGTVHIHDRIIDTLYEWDAIKPTQTVMDLGPYNHLGCRMKHAFDCYVRNTGEVDLDDSWQFGAWFADVVTAFNILEHVFNPLLVLRKGMSILRPGGKLYAAVPRRPSWLRSDYHFHEFDDYRWEWLVKRAGLKVTRHASFRFKHGGFGVVRPAIRRMYEREHIYEMEACEE